MNFVCNKSEPIAKTGKGWLRGYLFNTIYHFKGISYARAERFCPPGEAESWDGIKDALDYGYTCPLMIQDGINGDFLSPHRFWPQNEDCLNLNLWTPSLDSEAGLPVVVWLHGGGFFAGSSIEQCAYDGLNMSLYGNVVTVTLNHRLNVLGYMDLRGFGEKYERSANVGNLDIIAALQWIKENIKMFGGNPDNVTLFGQSGGGGKITALMQMPKADGLFHKAMIMSGISGELGTDPNIDMRPAIQYMLRDLGIKNVDQLQAVPYKKMVKSYLYACRNVLKTKGIPYFGPIKNQDYAGDPMQVGFTENAKKIPVIAGSTLSEFLHSPYRDPEMSDEEMTKILCDKYGADGADKLKKAFWKAYPQKKLYEVYDIDSSVRYATKKWIEKRLADGAKETYSYLFSLNFNFDGGTSAWHCSDIPFFFHNIDKAPVANIENVSETLQDQMFSAFMNFARHGKPDTDLLPKWPACSLENDNVMVFDRQSQVKCNFDAELIKIHYSLKVQNLHFFKEGDVLDLFQEDQ